MQPPWMRAVSMPSLPSAEVFEKGRSVRYGRSNPEQMDISFWEFMVRSGLGAYGARDAYGVDLFDGKGPVWTYSRIGMAQVLYRGSWAISIGGEHEDSYDPDFQIYNDVVIRGFDGSVAIFGYPLDDFPATDFHTATLIEGTGDSDSIYLIGGLGYPDRREFWHTPVYRLDLEDLTIQALECGGDEPGWIWAHQAVLEPDGQIRVSGGHRLDADGRTVLNDRLATLDVLSRKWS